MECITTLDDLITRLQELRAREGGKCRVLIRSNGELALMTVSLAATGKTTPFRTASRGGVPVVIVS